MRPMLAFLPVVALIVVAVMLHSVPSNDRPTVIGEGPVETMQLASSRASYLKYVDCADVNGNGALRGNNRYSRDDDIHRVGVQIGADHLVNVLPVRRQGRLRVIMSVGYWMPYGFTTPAGATGEIDRISMFCFKSSLLHVRDTARVPPAGW